MLAFFIASYQHLLWTPNSIWVPEGLLGRVWLSLPFLSNCLEPSGRNSTASTSVLTALYNSSTPTRSPTRSLKSNVKRHQAEITVMQFRGHSLPVHQSMRVSWDIFTSSHFISQFPPTQFPLITAIRMYHFLPVHHLEWRFWPGQKVKT